MERNRKAGQNPPRVVAPHEEEEEKEKEKEKEKEEEEVLVFFIDNIFLRRNLIMCF